MCKKEYINLQTKEILDLEKLTTLPDNAMLKVKPELWIEWDFEKNDELGFDVWKMTKGIGKKVWWICRDCDSSYDSFIPTKVKNQICPYCKGKKVNHTNSLAFLNPQLALEWHPTKNGELTPHDVTVGRANNIWWRCKNNHEWQARIYSRHGNGRGCPYCNGQRVITGHNDMWTTRPDIASLLLNPEDGYKYMQNTNIKLEWKCSDCGTVKKASGNDVCRRGISCSTCNDTRSYPEKVISSLLNKLNLEYDFDNSKDWSEGRRYDFYVPSLNMIIETHGMQHYKGLSFTKDKTSEMEKKNDELKRTLAIDNGIYNYIELDCRYSDFEYIKNSIIESKLMDILKISVLPIEASDIEILDNKIIKTWELVNEGLHIKEIAKKLNKSKSGIKDYIKKGMQSGKCNYNFERYHKMKKKIVSLSLEDAHLKIHECAKDASDYLKLKSPSNIGLCCRQGGKLKNHIFMYYDDYVKYLEGFKS